MKRSFLFFYVLTSILSVSHIFSTFIVHGNSASAPYGFTGIIGAKAYDQPSGTFYVGLDGSTTGTYVISRAMRPSFRNPQSFEAMVFIDDTNLYPMQRSQSIEFLSLSQILGTVPVIGTVTLNSTNSFSQSTVFGLQTPRVQSVTATDINGNTQLADASGIIPTRGIVNFVGSPHYFFALVRPSTPNKFGELNSGVALICVDRDEECEAQTLTGLGIKNATNGMPGNQAVALQQDSLVLKGTSGGADVDFSNAVDDRNKTALYYDVVLDRLYIGVRIGISATAANNYAKSVVVGFVNKTTNNSLNLIASTPDSAIIPNVTTQIVVGNNLSTLRFRPITIRALHASTGPDYLIVNGGQGITDSVGNKVYAIPLVNDPSNLNTHGTFAKKDAPLVNNVFVTPATANNDLAFDTDPAAVVGAGDLPFSSNTTISDMVVVGDTVYVSTINGPTPASDTGIFYSQAIFDTDGKVLRWSPWTKRVVPINCFPGVELPCCGMHTGPIQFFDIDAKNGTVWIVEGNCKELVGVTAWNSDTTLTNMVPVVSAALKCGCFAALDLDQATRGFYNTTNENYDTVNRYALFGGKNTVAFVLTSQAATNAAPVPLWTPQYVTQDFTATQSFLITRCTGCVQVLEYARQLSSEGNQNYFFAGTDNGLQVFSVNGNGFNANTLGTLDNAPFTSGSWTSVGKFIGSSVIDVKTSGQSLYVLTQELTENPKNPFIYSLYNISFQPTISAMFTSSNISLIARTGVDIFANVNSFYAIQIIATGNPNANPENKEQLILATNQGLFYSDADQSAGTGIIQATDQTDADWQVINGTNKTVYYTLSGMDVPIRNTVWPSTIEDQFLAKTFERSAILQLSGNGNATGNAFVAPTFDPEFFNANQSIPAFKTIDPITYFWSDGARRYFILKLVSDPVNKNQIAVIPFDPINWTLPKPTVLTMPIVDTTNRFYFIKMIGATGILVAGTDRGIIGLQ